MAILGSELSALLGELEQNPNNIIKLLTGLLESANDLESTLLALLVQRNVSNAIGAQLDVLGRIVDEDRNGLSDDDYRRFIGAKILVNRSSGTFPELIRIAAAIVAQVGAFYYVTQEGTATIRLRVSSTTGITDSLAGILFFLERLATSAGVRLVVQWGDVADSALFRFDSGPGFDVGRLAGAIG